MNGCCVIEVEGDVPPVTLLELKAHAVVEHALHDTILQKYLDAAIDYAGWYTQEALASGEVQARFPGPMSAYADPETERRYVFPLCLSPASEIGTVRHLYDWDGCSGEMDEIDEEWVTPCLGAQEDLYCAFAIDIPEESDFEWSDDSQIRVNYTIAARVDLARVKVAILQMATDLYERRAATNEMRSTPNDVHERLLWSSRSWA